VANISNRGRKPLIKPTAPKLSVSGSGVVGLSNENDCPTLNSRSIVMPKWPLTNQAIGGTIVQIIPTTLIEIVFCKRVEIYGERYLVNPAE
jgi:hypothetical protein